MATIKWHARAVTDLDRLREFLFTNNPIAATRAVRIIIQGITLLEKAPNLGLPMVDGSKRRELFIPFGTGSYVLRYFTKENSVIIVRVWHSREDRK